MKKKGHMIPCKQGRKRGNLHTFDALAVDLLVPTCQLSQVEIKLFEIFFCCEVLRLRSVPLVSIPRYFAR